MANAQPSEQEIQFRKRARRRLVGAVALVLLLIALLPMVLDDPPPPIPQTDIAISIPSLDSDEFTSRIVPVPDSSKAGAQPEPSPAVGADAEQVPEQPAAEAVPPVPQDKPSAAPQEAKDGLVVQIGVYADAANVNKLQDKLAAQGISTYTEKLVTAAGPRIRLRMGPYATRAEAEKGLEALKAAGITGMVVTR